MKDTNPADYPPSFQHQRLRHTSAMYPNTRQESPQQPGVGETQPETVINIDSDTAERPPAPPRVLINENSSKSTPPEKFATAVAAGLLSLVPIILTYTTLLRPDDLIKDPVGPLVAGAVVTLVNMTTVSWICTLATRTTSLGALFPLSFATLGGLMIIIFFGAAQSSKNLEFVEMNYKAVLICAGVFGGIGLGTTVEYLVYVQNERK